MKIRTRRSVWTLQLYIPSSGIKKMFYMPIFGNNFISWFTGNKTVYGDNFLQSRFWLSRKWYARYFWGHVFGDQSWQQCGFWDKYIWLLLWNTEYSPFDHFLLYFNCSHSLEIVKARFDEYAVKKQDFLGDEEKQKKVLSLITDENILYVNFVQSFKLVRILIMSAMSFAHWLVQLY